MIRFFLVPVVLGPTGVRVPKYYTGRFSPPGGIITAPAETHDYGNSPSMLVATNLDDAQSALLAAQPDVTKFADNLDETMGANLATYETALDAIGLPGTQMLGVNTTHRQTVRGVLGIFTVAQCMQGKGLDLFTLGIGLAQTLASMPSGAGAAVVACATANGYDMSAITLANTVRQFLVAIAQQAAPKPMLGVTV